MNSTGKMITIKNKPENLKLDDEDINLWFAFTWIEDNGYFFKRTKINGKYKKCYMHRMIMNANKGQIVDHINGDRADSYKTE